MKELEIIIPAYNAHKTIELTLNSIEKQINKDIFHVTIVNDNGNDYQDIINKYKSKLDIDEIRTSKNEGPGLARQYGIDKTDSKYILFIDADDYLYSNNAIDLLLNKIKKHNADLVISNFIYERDHEIQIKSENTIWLHGKIYRREFLDKNNIRFNDTRANEDNGFNKLFILLNPIIVYLYEITYVYHENSNSITRKDNRLYRFTGLEGYSYNMNWAMEEAEKRNANIIGIATTAISTLCALYYYYLELYEIYDVKLIIKWSKKIYLKYIKYKEIADKYKEKYLEQLENEYKDKKINKYITFDEYLKKVSDYHD